MRRTLRTDLGTLSPPGASPRVHAELVYSETHDGTLEANGVLIHKIWPDSAHTVESLGLNLAELRKLMEKVSVEPTLYAEVVRKEPDEPR